MGDAESIESSEPAKTTTTYQMSKLEVQREAADNWNITDQKFWLIQ